MKTYETRFALTNRVAEDFGAIGFEVKAAFVNRIGQPVIVMQREISENSVPEDWPPIDDTAMAVVSKVLEKAAMQ